MLWGGEFGRTPDGKRPDGLNHEKLTYRYAGRDFRPSDVHGHVAQEIFAEIRAAVCERWRQTGRKFSGARDRRLEDAMHECAALPAPRPRLGELF